MALSSLPVGKETEVADADEAWWEQMEQEAAEELVDGKADDALLVAVRGVTPAEADLTVAECDHPAVGDAELCNSAAHFKDQEPSLLMRLSSRPTPLST
jgi:hypothetical protein